MNNMTKAALQELLLARERQIEELTWHLQALAREASPFVPNCKPGPEAPAHCVAMLNNYMGYAESALATAKWHRTRDEEYTQVCGKVAAELQYLSRVVGQQESVHYYGGGGMGVTVAALLRPLKDDLVSALRVGTAVGLDEHISLGELHSLFVESATNILQGEAAEAEGGG